MKANSHKKNGSNNSAKNDGKAASTALEARFAQTQSGLNPRRQRLVRAILDAADETCFLSCRELAKAVASPSFLNSYVAPTAAITAIHVTCSHVDPKRMLSRLRPTDREYASGSRWYREPKGSNGNNAEGVG